MSAWLADWRIRVNEVSLSDPELRAVAFVSDQHAPTIALNTSHRSAADPRARRFTLAHELCHLLHDRSYGASLAIASGPWAPLAIEQRANAFAAWLLMPPDRLKPAIAWAPGLRWLLVGLCRSGGLPGRLRPMAGSGSLAAVAGLSSSSRAPAAVVTRSRVMGRFLTTAVVASQRTDVSGPA
ncbi:MAG: ImmA/IrrE family metallo-endopeptidase [Acidimicrobiales bacterium]|nr:ImmA/IrrE family metallo-endopeptidase [Acidimicrobiaceae bacterium]MXX42554.1 ImmA/IrrE family metallo-endopeptidase [Acidimicrobiales bacterium]MXZ13942.1 ImmA/IrrE family metallo-endopeptidase [Acidimicrobiales bacterium]MYD34029.1 ImmA/IrrE family metallo-endopeptidase [Acidimicrobiales bacterium]MYG61363.1 ImmA/IrrE family metallo-endopeptidase [Acidimicrobiales bacterium]